MAHRPGQKEETRERIVAGAGRGFRAFGYGGIGVDGLAKEAGVTSGAFYANFKSKASAFREVVEVGLEDLRQGVLSMRARFGAGWRAAFVDFYLGDRRTCDLSQSCALQSLTSEVARADEAVKQTYEEKLRAVLAAAAEGLPGETEEARWNEAVSLLALLIGGVSLARGVQDPQLSAAIAEAVRDAAARLDSEA